MTRRSPGNEHAELVEKLTASLSDKGAADIRMAHRSSLPPYCILSTRTGTTHVPDVSARVEGRLWLYEVETPETMRDGHIVDEWTSFYRYCSDKGSGLCIVVPPGFEKAAARRLKGLGIFAEVSGVG